MNKKQEKRQLEQQINMEFDRLLKNTPLLNKKAREALKELYQWRSGELDLTIKNLVKILNYAFSYNKKYKDRSYRTIQTIKTEIAITEALACLSPMDHSTDYSKDNFRDAQAKLIINQFINSL